MEKEFVPYEPTLELKELGFDDPCFAVYGKSEGYLFKVHTDKFDTVDELHFIKSPTFSQAFRWFRDKGYDVKISKENTGLYFGFYWTGVAWIIVGTGTYEEAELACLIKLIEIVKSK